MQGPWSYDDSMGGNTITASHDDSARCESCGGSGHAQTCSRGEV